MTAELRDQLRSQLQATVGATYSLERELGGGGMSRVFVAEERPLGRRVVIKVLPPELAAGVSTDRFRREILVAARLQHPHIVPVLAADSAGDVLYYTMPLVAGETLRERLLRERQLPLSDALSIARQVASALEYAHQQGVVHRDVKPENILLQGEDALLLDFGIARAVRRSLSLEARTSTGIVLGTPAYMSPEQASGDADELDARTDVYSLGCVLYEMLAGEPPYTGATSQAVIAKRFSDPVPSVRRLRETVPEAVDAAVRRAMAKAPADRFATAAALAAALGAAGTPVPGLPAAAHPARHETRRPRRWAWALGGGTLLVVGLGLAALVTQPSAPALDPRWVVVPEFENVTGIDSLRYLAKLAADWTTRALSQTGVVTVANAPGGMDDVGAPPPGSRGTPSALDVARRAQSGTVVLGRIYRERDTLRFQAQILNAKQGTLVEAVESRVHLDEAGRGVERIAERVAAVVAARFDSTYNSLLSPAAPAPSLIAYRTFTEAVAQARLTDGWSERFTSQLMAAAALDTTFSIPLVLAAEGYSKGFRNDAKADSIFSVLDGRRARLTPYERALIDKVKASISANWAQHYAATQQLRAIAPRSGYAISEFALAATSINRPREALEAIRMIDRTDSYVRRGGWHYPDWLDALLLLRRYDEAVDLTHQFAQRYPEQRQFLLGMQFAAFPIAGRVAEAEAVLEQLNSAGAGSNRAHGLSMVAARLVMGGHEREARRVYDAAIAEARKRWAATSDSLTDGRRLATALYLAKQWDKAWPILQWLAGRPEAGSLGRVRDLGMLGTIAASRGDSSEAARVDRLLALDRTPRLFGLNTYYRACIAAHLGDKPRAIALLEQSHAEGVRFEPYSISQLPGLAEPGLDPLRDYPQYQEFIRPKG